MRARVAPKGLGEVHGGHVQQGLWTLLLPELETLDAC